LTCPAPMYYSGDTYLGKYSPDGGDLADQEDFGLDFYEPLFFHPFGAWSENDDFSVDVTFDDATMTKDIFYFCHIHQFMSGRIKLMDADGNLLNEEDTPVIGYDYDTIDSFDSECGTYNTTDYKLPHGQCPTEFVCDVEGGDDVKAFAGCIEAMNCHMMTSMTTNAVSEQALFIHQMIPHHQNAVNMAKALLKTGKVKCDASDNESDDCELEGILRTIISQQNHQILSMKGILEGDNIPEYSDCVVAIE